MKVFFSFLDFEDEFVQQGGASLRSPENGRRYKMSIRFSGDRKTSSIFSAEKVSPVIFNEISGEVRISPPGWNTLKRYLESSNGKKQLTKIHLLIVICLRFGFSQIKTEKAFKDSQKLPFGKYLHQPFLTAGCAKKYFYVKSKFKCYMPT